MLHTISVSIVKTCANWLFFCDFAYSTESLVYPSRCHVLAVTVSVATFSDTWESWVDENKGILSEWQCWWVCCCDWTEAGHDPDQWWCFQEGRVAGADREVWHQDGLPDILPEVPVPRQSSQQSHRFLSGECMLHVFILCPVDCLCSLVPYSCISSGLCWQLVHNGQSINSVSSNQSDSHYTGWQPRWRTAVFVACMLLPLATSVFRLGMRCYRC